MKSVNQFPRIGFGGAPIGNFAGDIQDDDAMDALATAWSEGVRVFDTSPWYGLGLSEHRVGRFLRGKSREDFWLSTKVGRILVPSRQPIGRIDRKGPWTNPLDFDVRFDYSYDGIVRSFEDSLQRLGLPSVDELFIHDLDYLYHRSDLDYSSRLHQLINGGFDALRDLKADGRIRSIGAGINSPEIVTDLLDRFDLDSLLIAGPYTLIDHRILDTEMSRCHSEGVRVTIGAAFSYGILVTGASGRLPLTDRPEEIEMLSKVRRIEEICARMSVALPAAALQFPAAHPAVQTVLAGAVNGQQVRESQKWANEAIPDAFWQELIAAGLLAANAPIPSHGGA